MPPMTRTLSGATLVAIALALAISGPSAASSAGPEQEVLAAQDLWRQAMTRKDRAAFEKVLHPDLRYGHSSGLIETKAQAIQHVLGSTAIWERIDFRDTQVNIQGDTAIVTGKVDVHQRGTKNRTLIKLVVLSVWRKGPPGWQMIARQATRPEPPSNTPLR
jgi:ketosteroid isomerase-like protein